MTYTDDTIVTFISERTRETLLELKMHQGALIVWGVAPRDRFESRLQDGVVHFAGELCDKVGPVMVFERDQVEYLAGVRVQVRACMQEPELGDISSRGGGLVRG